MLGSIGYIRDEGKTHLIRSTLAKVGTFGRISCCVCTVHLEVFSTFHLNWRIKAVTKNDWNPNKIMNTISPNLHQLAVVTNLTILTNDYQ